MGAREKLFRFGNIDHILHRLCLQGVHIATRVIPDSLTADGFLIFSALLVIHYWRKKKKEKVLASYDKKKVGRKPK